MAAVGTKRSWEKARLVLVLQLKPEVRTPLFRSPLILDLRIIFLELALHSFTIGDISSSRYFQLLFISPDSGGGGGEG